MHETGFSVGIVIIALRMDISWKFSFFCSSVYVIYCIVLIEAIEGGLKKHTTHCELPQIKKKIAANFY